MRITEAHDYDLIGELLDAPTEARRRRYAALVQTR